MRIYFLKALVPDHIVISHIKNNLDATKFTLSFRISLQAYLIPLVCLSEPYNTEFNLSTPASSKDKRGQFFTSIWYHGCN